MYLQGIRKGAFQTRLQTFNTLRPRENGRHFADNICKCICMNENLCILFQIPLNFIPKGPIDNKLAMVQVTVWRRTGAKPLPELMLTQFTDAYMRYSGEVSEI